MPHVYEPLLDLLSKHYHVVAPTHPGHGRSFPINELWSYDDYVVAYSQFIASLSDRPQIFVGHSFGGALSFSLARNFPHASVIAIDTAGLPFPFIVKDFLSALVREGEGALKKNPDVSTIKELVLPAWSYARSV
jgi:pimeloyl-ACP methyl ester carboxylesterase